MYFCKHTARRLLACALVLCALTGAVCAAELTLDCASVQTLTETDFSESGTLSGIYISSVPSAAICEIRLDGRRICAGDVLSADTLDKLTLVPLTQREAQTALTYRPIQAGALGAPQTLRFTLTSGKNAAPIAADSELETYKNISNSGVLSVSDPDGDALEFTLVREPKRGTVELHADGSFTYTPDENKVGKDSFIYTATDTAGNVSEEATVKIRIVRPTDKAVYTDISDENRYTAVWLREHGVYSGRTLAGNLCFGPNETLTRGEFLVMAMSLFDREPEEALLTSGFADEESAPEWMRPYIVSAFRSGMISGSAGEDGLLFRPTEPLSYAEAAVMLQSIADLPQLEAQSVFGGDADTETVPVWAQSAAAALRQAGISFPAEQAQESITRLAAGELLMQTYSYAQKTANQISQ